MTQKIEATKLAKLNCFNGWYVSIQTKEVAQQFALCGIKRALIALDTAILATPTGEARNQLCNANIAIMMARELITKGE